jgi:hypothetical protein
MHRSGTTMVTRLLMQLGLFVGAELEGNSEALFFLRLNEWIMQQSGAAWDHPKQIDDLLTHTDARTLAANYIRASMDSRLAVKYLGLRKYFQFRTPINLNTPWGWKDPRNTFTLPLWLDLFPDARVINVIRHGVDVSQSLRTRSQGGLENYIAQNKFRQRIPRLGSCLRESITDSMRCLSLDGGFSLWEAYTQRAREHVASLGKRAIEIRYETLLDQPAKGLRDLTQFCDLPASDEAVRRCSELVRAERAFAYRSNEALVRFAEQHFESLKANGYSHN